MFYTSPTSSWKRKATINSLMKYMLYFATPWQLNKTLLLLSLVSFSLPSPEGPVGCQGKLHLSDIFEVGSMVTKWEVSYPKGKKKALGYV